MYLIQHYLSLDPPPSCHTFSAKEKDSETGYSYFGARYYDSDVSVWLSVDPMADKYPSTSGYMYVLGNPIAYIDPDGKFSKRWTAELSRGWYNMWHKDNASPVQYNPNASKSNRRYSYSTGQLDENGVFAFTEVNKFSKDDKKTNKGSFWNLTGGFHFTSSIGRGNEGRKGSSNSIIMNIDNLLDLLGAGSRATTPKNPFNLAEPVRYPLDMFSAGMDITDGVQQAIKEVKDMGAKKGDQRASGTYKCPTCNEQFSAADTSKHNEDLNRKSGPFTPVKKEE